MVKKCDLFYLNSLTNFYIGFLNLVVVGRRNQFFFVMIIEYSAWAQLLWG